MKLYHYGEQTGLFKGSVEANIDPKETASDKGRYDNEVSVINGLEISEEEKKNLVEKVAVPKKHYLIPANSTTKKPPITSQPSSDDVELAVFDEEGHKWSVVKNLIGTVYHFPDKEGKFTMNVLGVLPSGAVEGVKPLTDDQKWDKVRGKRYSLLQSTDWTQTVDCPLPIKKQDEFRAYRKTLRDIPQDQTDPDNIVWPKMVE